MRDEIIKYLYDSGFVAFYVKKLLFSSDIENLYQDYVQETWLQICEVNENKWKELMDNNDNKHDRYYTVRNWISMLIRNTVRSTTSTAYRKLKKQSTITQQCNEEEWKFLSNTIPDGTTITQSIINQQ